MRDGRKLKPFFHSEFFLLFVPFGQYGTKNFYRRPFIDKLTTHLSTVGVAVQCDPFNQDTLRIFVVPRFSVAMRSIIFGAPSYSRIFFSSSLIMIPFVLITDLDSLLAPISFFFLINNNQRRFNKLITSLASPKGGNGAYKFTQVPYTLTIN